MLPYVEFLGVDLYTWAIIAGVIAAVVLFRIFCDKRKLPKKVFNFAFFIALSAIVVGYLSAVLFQAIFSFRQDGVWDWQGATFAGGLIGAVVFFLLLYFGIGHCVFKNKEHVYYLSTVVSCAFPCIVIAHAFGRIGCLFAGCCYGLKTESWLGIEMLIDGVWEKRLPTQLFEAVFLVLLFAVLTYLLLKRNEKNVLLGYLFGYGTWRFALEFVRDDSARGASVIPFFTPSQTISVLMIILGIVILILRKFVLKNFWTKFNEKYGEKIESI
ncbi:MAG: prolipoprotein diacylglyceryl transferase [Candidatus Fimimonas sp.]